MIKKLRRRLILLYTCSTGVILTAVLILALIITSQQMLRNKKEAFQNNYMTVTQKIVMNNEVSHLWLAEMETENHLIIHVEDCGQALWYKGSWPAITDRNILINKAKKLAEKDSIYTNIKPISINEVQSKIYEFKGDKHDRYLGRVFISATNDGYRSIVILQYISEDFAAVIKQRILIILLYLAGVSSLFFVSRWIVGKSVKPIEESRRRQTQFIASASHELKSPLAVIRANASALMIEPENTEHFSNGIDKECMRMSLLIEDLLLLASVDAQNWSVKKELVDMDILLIESYDLFLPYCAEKGKGLKLDLKEDVLPKVEGDSLRIRQILSVLIDNAVSYTLDKDIIILRAYVKKNQIFIEVEDHGIGIDKCLKNEVFDRFYKGDRSRRDKAHYGLGLSIAKELTELHGGKIGIRDTQGGGATFIVSLPTSRSRRD